MSTEELRYKVKDHQGRLYVDTFTTQELATQLATQPYHWATKRIQRDSGKGAWVYLRDHKQIKQLALELTTYTGRKLATIKANGSSRQARLEYRKTRRKRKQRKKRRLGTYYAKAMETHTELCAYLEIPTVPSTVLPASVAPRVSQWYRNFVVPHKAMAKLLGVPNIEVFSTVEQLVNRSDAAELRKATDSAPFIKREEGKEEKELQQELEQLREENKKLKTIFRYQMHLKEMEDMLGSLNAEQKLKLKQHHGLKDDEQS